MSFRRRDYPEVLDSLLTALVGGISAERHPFPPPGDAAAPRHLLDAPPARLLVSSFGTRNGLPFRFRSGADLDLSPDGTAVVWRTGGARPDPGSLVDINYLRRDTPATLTDLEVGSVARTLVEAVGRELARLSAQLEAVHDAGFLETATGSALDRVVALLGIERVPADRAEAELRFTRADGAPGAVTIPAGTRVMDEAVTVEYATVAAVTMAPAQASISVAARDLEPANDPVPAGTLTVLAVPIAGILGVTNPEPARPAARAETDAELKIRAQSFLHGSEKATPGAFRTALARQGVRGEIAEPGDRPGVVVVSPVAAGLSPERREQLLAALEDTRAAGVRVELAGIAVPAAVELDVALVTAAGLGEPDRRAAHASVKSAIEGFFAALPIREDARLSRLTGAVLAVPGVEDLTILGARVRAANGTVADRLDPAAGLIRLADQPTRLSALAMSDPALPTRADLVIRFPEAAAPPDRAAVITAIEAAFAHLATAPAGDPRLLSFGKLLRVLPAPVGQGLGLAAFDAAPDPKPALPAAAGVYGVSLFLAQANGLTRILAAPGDAHPLASGERIALGAVTLSAEA